MNEWLEHEYFKQFTDDDGGELDPDDIKDALVNAYLIGYNAAVVDMNEPAVLRVAAIKRRLYGA